MSTYLAKMQKAADIVRAKKAVKGFYEYSGQIIPLTGGNPRHGIPPVPGTPIVLLPGIEVENVSLKAVESSSGALMQGDIKVSGLSRIQFPDETIISSLGNEWLMVGPALAGKYSLIQGMVRRYDTEWIVTLRLKAPK